MLLQKDKRLIFEYVCNIIKRCVLRRCGMINKDPLLKNISTRKIKDIWLLHDKNNGLLYDPYRKCWFPDGRVSNVVLGKIKSLSLNTINLMRCHYIKTYNELKLIDREIDVISNVNKSKYQIEFEQFPVDYRFKDIKAQIPVLLTNEILLQSIIQYKESTYPELFVDLDYVRVIISAITIRYSYKKYNYKRLNSKFFGENMYNKGWVQIRWEEFRLLATRDFEPYLSALIASNIVMCDGVHWHFNNAKPGANKARCYKINDIYYNDSEQLHYYVDYTNYRIKLRLLKYKYSLRAKNTTTNTYYNQLIHDVELLFGQIDEQQIKSYYENRVYEFYDVDNEEELQLKLLDENVIKLNEFVEHVRVIKDNHKYYYNACDNFGGRFHSIMTNTTTKIRRFVEYKGVSYAHIDIRNSQMVILATLITYPDVVKQLLPVVEVTIGNNTMHIFNYYELLLHNANINIDKLQQFCSDAMNGIMYDKMADHMKISRAEAKLDAMKIIFSNNTQYRKLKYDYSSLYPELIKLCDALNCEQQIHLIPKITQLIESEIFINRIVREFVSIKKYPAITIHDSVLLHPHDVSAFISCYNKTFKIIGITPFLISKICCNDC